MLLKTKLILSLKQAIALAHRCDPTTAVDNGYIVKSALQALFAEAALRPWTAEIDMQTRLIHVTGWSDGPLGASETQDPTKTDYLKGLVVSVSQEPLEFEAGSTHEFSLLTIPLIRTRNVARDAAAGSENPKAAYRNWLMERLTEDRMGALLTTRIEIERMRKVTVVRKLSKGAQSILQPEILAVGQLQVTNPGLFEMFLRTGVGPQKAFGYGALMLPLSGGCLIASSEEAA